MHAWYSFYFKVYFLNYVDIHFCLFEDHRPSSLWNWGRYNSHLFRWFLRSNKHKYKDITVNWKASQQCSTRSQLAQQTIDNSPSTRTRSQKLDPETLLLGCHQLTISSNVSSCLILKTTSRTKALISVNRKLHITLISNVSNSHYYLFIYN